MSGQQNRVSLLRRTKMCTTFRRHGACEFGDQCAFAHSRKQLRHRPTQAGKGPSLQTPSIERRDFMFTRLCDNVEKGLPCPYGDECYFAHNTAEIALSIEEVIDSRSQSSDSSDCSDTDEGNNSETGERVVQKQTTVQVIVQRASATGVLIQTANKALRQVCGPEHANWFGQYPSSPNLPPPPLPITSVWSRSAFPYPGHYWGHVMRPAAVDYYRPFDALKPDTTTVPRVPIRASDRFLYLQSQCASLYGYINAHYTGVRASALLPKLRYVFPELLGYADRGVLRLLSSCADVWIDRISLRQDVLVHVT